MFTLNLSLNYICRYDQGLNAPPQHGMGGDTMLGGATNLQPLGCACAPPAVPSAVGWGAPLWVNWLIGKYALPRCGLGWFLPPLWVGMKYIHAM